MLIIHVYITIHHSFMYKEAQQHRTVPLRQRGILFIALGCNLQFVSMRWVHFHSPACASMRCRSLSHWRESSSKASCSFQFNVSASRLWNPLLLLHVLGPSCASMCRRVRPCASIHVHAVQCAPMRLLVGPTACTSRPNVKYSFQEPYVIGTHCLGLSFFHNL